MHMHTINILAAISRSPPAWYVSPQKSIKIANYAPCALGAHPPPTLILLGRQGSPLVPPGPKFYQSLSNNIQFGRPIRTIIIILLLMYMIISCEG